MKPFIGIPAVVILVYRAYSRKSLTPLGLITAALTASIHAIHPWSAPFVLLAVFYFGGTKATKVKHDIKARLTLSATGAEGGEGQRTHTQVLANSVVATVLILLHTRLLAAQDSSCFSHGRGAADLLAVGIVANYAAVTADTFSSELGILSKSKPRLITSLTLREVPPGTNGGVTAGGLLAGVGGAFLIALTSAVLVPFCSSNGGGLDIVERAQYILAIAAWGGLGSVLDSVLGGILQASVVDKRSGKIVEGTGGQKVLVHPSSTKPEGTAGVTGLSYDEADGMHLRNTEAVANAAALRGTKVTGTSAGSQAGQGDPSHESRKVESGRDLLDNNGVNLLMAATMSLGAMSVASWWWSIPLSGIFA